MNLPKTSYRFLAILLFASIASFSQTEITLHDFSELEDIGSNVAYLEDPSSTLQIEDLISDNTISKFKPYDKKIISFPLSNSTYWIKFKIKKATEGNFFLHLNSAYISSLSLYEIDSENTLISTKQTGDAFPFATRDVEISDYLFSLDIDKNDTRTFYLKVKNEEILLFRLRVGTLNNFMAYSHDLDFTQGIYFGFMILVVIYTFFLYFSTKNNIYLFYTSYVFSFTLFMFYIQGYLFEFLYPNTPAINQLISVSPGVVVITATLFSQKFFNSKIVSPLIYKTTHLFIGFGVLICLLHLFGYQVLSLQLTYIVVPTMGVYFLVIGYIFHQRGYRPAKYYMIAWGVLVLGICFSIFESVYVGFKLHPYLSSMQIGSALEVILLSFAVGDNLRLFKAEKEEAQVHAIAIAKENKRLVQEQNTILEKKVARKTKKIALQNEKLVKLNKEKDVLIGVVAHDLRNPLHQIKAFLELLDVKKLPVSDDHKLYLTQIDKATNRMTKMISSILDEQTLLLPDTGLKLKILKAEKIVTSAMKSLHFKAAQKQISMRINIEKGNHYIQVADNYMIQILENLLSNAIKYSNRGSEVIVHLTSNHGKTHIIVQDFGPGVTKEDQQKMFGRFQRLSAQPTEGETSTGLGLSIVKKYIEAMNGTVHCESQFGQGSKFILTLNTKEKSSK